MCNPQIQKNNSIDSQGKIKPNQYSNPLGMEISLGTYCDD